MKEGIDISLTLKETEILLSVRAGNSGIIAGLDVDGARALASGLLSGAAALEKALKAAGPRLNVVGSQTGRYSVSSANDSNGPDAPREADKAPSGEPDTPDPSSPPNVPSAS